MIKTKKQMYIVIGVFALVMMLGTVTYAFFNYTRTGSANTVSTGTINFNAVQGTAINLTNAFPIDPTETGIMNDNTKVGSVTINVTGDTSYSEGIEYLVKAVNVQNTVGNKNVPISIDVSYVANGQGKSIGTEDEEYFDHRGGSTSYYRVLAKDTISSNDDLVVGYIAPSNNGTGIDGNIVIKAYIDKNKIAITDTYPEGDVTHTEGEEPNQETIVDYTNGTTSNWVGTRTVFTTTEWNNLQQAGGISFQVKVEANEGTWVEENLTVNTMSGSFPTVITAEKDNIKEVYFNKMGATRMQDAYDAATIKADLTYNNEGKVLAWLEVNQDDNTKYNLIIASDGDTYLTTGYQLFENWGNVSNIEFNNINTTRVTDLTAMFYGCSSLASLDLSDFNTSNVIDMNGMLSGCSSLVSLNMDDWNLSSVLGQSGVLGGTISLKEMSCKRWILPNNFSYWLFTTWSASTVETLDVTGWNLSNTENISALFLKGSTLKNLIGLETWDTSNITNMEGLFNQCSSLTEIDLSSFNTSNVTNMTSMFLNCSSLSTIIVSSLWNTSNVSNSGGMFFGNTSLVGQAHNTTYAFDSNDALDKTYAIIATDNAKGYLTDISLKPTN